MLMFLENRLTRPRKWSSKDRRTGSVTPPTLVLDDVLLLLEDEDDDDDGC